MTPIWTLALVLAAAPPSGQTSTPPAPTSGQTGTPPAPTAGETPDEAEATAANEGDLRVLLMTTRHDGKIPAGDRRLLDLALAEALGRRDGVVVLAQSEVKAALDLSAARQQLGCDDDEACMAAISAQLNADLVVNTQLGAVGSQLTLSASVFDAETMGVKGRATSTAASFDDLLTAVPELLAEAMGWEGAAPARRFSLEDLKDKSFAVFPLGATGVDADTVRNLTELVASEVKRVEGVSVLGMSDVEALLEVESDRAQLGCTDDNSCLAELGGALGVDKIITGEVGRVGKRLLIGLRMIDREAVVVDNRVTEAFEGPDEQLLFATRHAVRTLLGIEADGEGKLVVTANRSGATLFVDGERKGTVPGPPLDGLKPGKHALRVSAPGFYDWQAEVYVEPEGTTAQWVELEEEPRLVKPFVPAWVYWSSWAVTGAVGVGAVVAGVFTGGAVAFYRLQLAGDENGHVDGAALGQTYNAAATGLWITAGASVLGGALAGATGLSTLVVTWEEGS